MELTFNKSPAELLAITSPCSDIAKDKKFCDFIKEDIERISQIKDPSFVLKEINLLSWLIKKILFLKIFIFYLNGIPWFLIQTILPSLKEIA